MKGQTLLATVRKHEIHMQCKLCGHSGFVRVADVLDRHPAATVSDLVSAGRCGKCKKKGEHEFRISYRGGSDEAMRGAEQGQSE
jgi:hypothetical protein